MSKKQVKLAALPFHINNELQRAIQVLLDANDNVCHYVGVYIL